MTKPKHQNVWKPEHGTPNKDWAIQSSFNETCRAYGNDIRVACMKAIEPCKGILKILILIVTARPVIGHGCLQVKQLILMKLVQHSN